MTKKEAAHIVDVAFGIPQAVRRAGEDRTYHEEEIREAKEMALKALEQEPCEGCISRQAVLEVIRKCHCEEWIKADIGASIEALLSDTPAEKVGRWEWVQYDGNPNIGNWHCSECHCVDEDGKPSYKYCPQCGCKMQEVDNEEA